MYTRSHVYMYVAGGARLPLSIYAHLSAMCRVRGGVNGGQWHERARSGPLYSAPGPDFICTRIRICARVSMCRRDRVEM